MNCAYCGATILEPSKEHPLPLCSMMAELTGQPRGAAQSALRGGATPPASPSIRHRIAHLLGWNYGRVESWRMDNGEAYIGFRCTTCGDVSGSRSRFCHPKNCDS